MRYHFIWIKLKTLTMWWFIGLSLGHQSNEVCGMCGMCALTAIRCVSRTPDTSPSGESHNSEIRDLQWKRLSRWYSINNNVLRYLFFCEIRGRIHQNCAKFNTITRCIQTAHPCTYSTNGHPFGWQHAIIKSCFAPFWSTKTTQSRNIIVA